MDPDLYRHPVRDSFLTAEAVNIDERGKAKVTFDDPEQPGEMFFGFEGWVEGTLDTNMDTKEKKGMASTA